VVFFQYKAGLKESLLQIHREVGNIKIEINLLVGIVVIWVMAIFSTWLINEIITSAMKINYPASGSEEGAMV
jgi:hypothetical protein